MLGKLGRTQTMLVALCVVAAAGACGDTTGLRATFNNREVPFEVFPVNGTAETVPAGILIRAPELARVDSRFAFDIAFDMDASGNVTIYTTRALASEVLPSISRIGLQITNDAYVDVKRAPAGGFAYDSSVTLPVGKTLLIDKLDGACAQFGGSFLGYNIKAKMVIDSIRLSSRSIFVKMLSNPNCGFRSLETGLPKE